MITRWAAKQAIFRAVKIEDEKVARIMKGEFEA